MTLASGMRLGPYEILSLIGAGGMGEVYQASDTRLNRTVAIKVLPPHFSENTEMRQRFEREAQTIAGLNHPHICTLYDVGRHHDTDYLVMEYLEGETLAQRLERGAMSLADTLKVAIEIADALDKAHRQGVVHRDLKPSNVMLTKGGTKLLDFGLAKLKTPQETASVSTLPTRLDVTSQGTIVGTLQYMSPEQIEGQELDPRTDIFAFGGMLHEMLTGRKAFEGKTQASLIGAILKDVPKPVSMLQPLSPPAVDRLIATCLEKDPDDRWQTARDVCRELKWAGETSASTVLPSGTRRHGVHLVWIARAIIAVVVIALAIPAYLYLRGTRVLDEMRFLIPAPTTLNTSSLSVSPDGRWIAFVGASSPGRTALFVRPIGSVDARPLADTESATQPFWSADSRSIGFIIAGDRVMKRVNVEGGRPQTICAYPAVSFAGGTWNQENIILFGSDSGLFRVSALGGEPAQITGKQQEEYSYASPSFLPDGRHYIYTAAGGTSAPAFVYVGSLDSDKSVQLFEARSKVVFAEPGFLFFHRDGVLFAQSFDPDKQTLAGEPVRIADQVAHAATPGVAAAFDASQNGILIYRTAGASAVSQFQWFDRTGKPLGAAGAPGPYAQYFDLSPDARQIAVSRRDPTTGNPDIWLIDWARGVTTRATFDRANEDRDVAWSPDGVRIAFSSFRKGNPDIAVKSATVPGEETPLVESPNREVVEDWSKDGRYIAYGLDSAGSGTSLARQDIYVLPLFGDRKPIPITVTPYRENEPHFSFDGKWIAYDSNESGTFQVYVVSFPSLDQRRQISTNGGGQPLWRRDGKELYYLAADGKVMAVDITLGATIDSGIPRALFDTGLALSAVQDQYRVTPDGQRFLVLKPVVEATPTPITVVVNWVSSLRK